MNCLALLRTVVPNRERQIRPHLRQIFILVLLLQILSAAFVAPAVATTNTGDTKSTISVAKFSLHTDRINEEEQQLGTGHSDFNVALNRESDNDCATDKGTNTNRCDNTTTNSGGCDSDDGTSDMQTDTSNIANDGTLNNTTTDSGSSGARPSSTPSKTTKTSAEPSTEITHTTTTKISDEQPAGTTHATTTNAKTETSQNPNKMDLPGSGGLPNINSPMIALLGVLCVVGGLIAITRRWE